jgi:hypothetical protein
MCFSKPDWRGYFSKTHPDRSICALQMLATIAIGPIQGKRSEKCLEVSSVGG